MQNIACEQALRGALGAGWEKEGELATTSLEFEFRLQFPCGFLSTELSDFCQSARSGDKCECKQTLKNTWKHVPRVMTSLLMSSPPISTSHRLFQCRYSNSRDVVAIYPFFSRPANRAPWRAGSQATQNAKIWLSLTVKWFLTTFSKGSSYMFNYMWFSWEGCFCLMQSSFQTAKIFDCIGQTSNVPFTCKSLLV